MALPDTQVVPEAHDIADQVVERVRALDGCRLAVPALVVAQDVEVSASAASCSSHMCRFVASELEKVSQGPLSFPEIS